MKKKYLTILSILTILVISACGGPTPIPTLSVADLQGTAVANAWIAITQTQATIPTATQTPIPPTSTATLEPLPTVALLLIPTLELLPVATLPDTSTATDPCNAPAPVKPKGTTVTIKLINKSGGSVAPLSLGMMKENSLKECGIYTFSLGQYDEPVAKILAGCYWGFGYVNGDKPSTPQTSDALCVTDTTKTTSIWVTKDLISFH
jgi:hypothetical protein